MIRAFKGREEGRCMDAGGVHSQIDRGIRFAAFFF